MHELNSGLNLRPTSIKKIPSQAFLLLSRASHPQGRNLLGAGGGSVPVMAAAGCLPANGHGTCPGQAQKKKSKEDGREAGIGRLQATSEKKRAANGWQGGKEERAGRRTWSCPGPQTTAAHGRPQPRSETKKSLVLNKKV